MVFFYVIKQYERAVVFRLGKITGEARGPGLIFIVPFAHRIDRVSLRIVTMPIQSQGIITQDNVSIDVSAVAYYRVRIRFGRWSRSRMSERRSARSPRPRFAPW
jgi:regulator of protease activity HflC (stomatin/prohibitin superfamily)